MSAPSAVVMGLDAILTIALFSGIAGFVAGMCAMWAFVSRP